MAKYSYITDKTNGNRKIQVESAIRDGDGKNIVNNYAKQNGYYENMGVGQADNLSTDRQIDNPETACPPITMGITGGEAEIKSGIENFDYLEGKSIVFNQQKVNGDMSTTNTYGAMNGTITLQNNVLSYASNSDSPVWYDYGIRTSFELVKNHKYQVNFTLNTNKTGLYVIVEKLNNGNNVNLGFSTTSGAKKYSLQFTCNHNIGTYQVRFCGALTTADTLTLQKVNLFDLTAMFGAGNEPTTDQFNALFPLDYYAYNAGSILSAKTNALISRGRQQWDEVWELGYYDTNTGAKSTANDRIRCKNLIPCIGNQQYYFGLGDYTSWVNVLFYDINKNFIGALQNGLFGQNAPAGSVNYHNPFTTPSNCAYMTFYLSSVYGTTYHNDITISIYFEDGEGYSEYYPYSQDSVELPNIELRAIGDLKDIAYASGGGKRRLGIIDLGTLTWARHSDSRFVAILTDAKLTTTSVVANLLCAKYLTKSADNVYNKVQDKILGAGNDGLNRQQLWVYDSAYNDAATFKTSLSGVYLVYELATETELTENEGWDNTINVDNYGTLEFTTDPQQVPQVEQPYFIKYTVNLGEWIDSAYVRTSGDADDIALKSEMDALEQELVDGDIVVAKSKLSDNLDTNVVQNDVDAYTFRTAGGSLEIGETCKVKEIVGGTVAFNQLAMNGNFENTSIWNVQNGTLTVSNNIGSFTATAQNALLNLYNLPTKNHKVLFSCDIKTQTATTEVRAGIRNEYKSISSSTSWQTISFVTTAQPNSSGNIFIQVEDKRASGWDTIQVRNVMLVDLTVMFGSTIADYIYSLEQATTGAGVAWFKRYFPKTYYAYNAGTLVNVKTSGKKYVGFNQWDEQWENGTWDGNGAKQGNSASIRNKNPIRVLPNTTYYVKAPADVYFWAYDENMNYLGRIPSPNGYRNNTVNFNDTRVAYINLGMWKSTYENNICLNFHYDGERDGEYEPYESNEYALSPIELRGIAKKDAQGNLYFDGDSYTPDGKIVRRYGIVDLGTLDWTSSNDFQNCFYATLSDKLASSLELVCSKYYNLYDRKYAVTLQNDTTKDKCICCDYSESSKIVIIKDTAYTNATNFKTAMSGAYLVYELATPTEETTDTYQETQQVDNWGTEQYLPPESDTRPCEIPVGHITDYLLDIRSKVEIMPDSPTDDGVYVVETSSGTNEYIPLGTWLANNDYKQSKDLPTKDALGGTLRQILVFSKNVNFTKTTFVDLGTLTYEIDNGRFKVFIGTIKIGTSGVVPNIVSTLYKTVPIADTETVDMSISVSSGQHVLFIRNNAYNNADTFKNAMKGVLVAFETD